MESKSWLKRNSKGLLFLLIIAIAELLLLLTMNLFGEIDRATNVLCIFLTMSATLGIPASLGAIGVKNVRAITIAGLVSGVTAAILTFGIFKESIGSNIEAIEDAIYYILLATIFLCAIVLLFTKYK